MITTRTTALHDLFGESFRALTPAAADVDRPRLMRRLKRAARMLQEASDPFIAHLRRSGFRESRVVAYTHRPFDTRWLYADPSADFNYLAHVAAPNQFIVASAAGAFVTRRATIEQSSPASLFPLYRVRRDGHAASLTEEAREFVRRNGIAESDLFHHAVAMVVGQAIVPVRTGEIACPTTWVPLPDDKHAIRSSAVLGYRIATLFADDDPLAPHDAELRTFAVPSRTGKEARMLRGSALNVSDSWAERETIEIRPFTPEEFAAVGSDEALALLGGRTCDVYINDRALLRNVPLAAWRYAHRDVPLLRAWLADRRASALARPLLREEITQLSLAARRITALLLLGPAVEKNAAALRTS